MPLQNRVTPEGEIVAADWRGAFTGNRGCLHDDEGRLGRARWRHRAWVCCLLAFRGRHRAPMPPGRWTALFFWDEAVALAAGHRPCGECRHADYRAFVAAWRAAGLPGERAAERDRHLHAARVRRDRSRVTHRAVARDLPDGCFVIAEDGPALVWRGALRPWRGPGYGAARTLPAGEVEVLTPAPSVAALSAGYRVAPRL